MVGSRGICPVTKRPWGDLPPVSRVTIQPRNGEDGGPVTVQRWAGVVDAGPALNRHRGMIHRGLTMACQLCDSDGRYDSQSLSVRLSVRPSVTSYLGLWATAQKSWQTTTVEVLFCHGLIGIVSLWEAQPSLSHSQIILRFPIEIVFSSGQ